MFATGDLKVHKTDGVTRRAQAVKVIVDGGLAVWDEVPDDEVAFVTVSQAAGFQLLDKRTEEIIEPDIIVQGDMWQRIERDGHYWKRTSPAALKERAEERDDVDEDEIDI